MCIVYVRRNKAERQKSFVFTPDDPITTPEEFTAALFEYANVNNLNLVITREGLNPEFEIDGIAYTAQRVYRRAGLMPVLTVRCTARNPQELEPDVTGFRGKAMKFIHNWWPLMLTALLGGFRW